MQCDSAGFLLTTLMQFIGIFNPISTIIASGGKSCETYPQALQIIYSHRAINSINTHPQL
jgi:hypothetical protein